MVHATLVSQRRRGDRAYRSGRAFHGFVTRSGACNAVPARASLGNGPLSGYLFEFLKRTQARRFFWGRTGYCALAKRRARGRFWFIEQVAAGCRSVWLEGVEPALVLTGIELKDTGRTRW
jgi:hypothetical protein